MFKILKAIYIGSLENSHHKMVNHLNRITQEWQRSQPAATRNRGKSIGNSPLPTYDQEPATVVDDDKMSKEKEIDNLMALISLSYKKIYKPTNNNLKTSSNTSRANQDNSLRINRGTGYDNQRVVNIAGAREDVEVTPDAADNSGPIFDVEPLQKVQNDDDNYNVFDNDQKHPEQPESVNEPYSVEQDKHNIIIDSLDMCYDREQDDEDDTDDLAKERDLLASLIEKLKCEIYDSKNRNKFLESSNKALVDKLKGEIKDFKTKNKSLESSNNHFKEANNKLSKTNQLMFKDLKKFQVELDRYHDVNYASKVAIDCAKAKGDLMEYYYVDHMHAILGVYTTLDEFTNLQCDYVDQVVKCERLEKELSKNLKAQLQDKGIAISKLKKLIEKMKGKSVETKFEKPLVIRQPNPFKSQRQSVLGVIPTTSVSRPQLKSNQMKDRITANNSHGKKQEVEDHHMNFKFSYNKMSVTACNDSLNAKTSNVNFVCVTCGKCVLNDNHDMCVLNYINGVNFGSRQPIGVPISTREPKQNVNQFVATSHKKIVAIESIVKKPRNIIRKLYEQLVEIILFIVDSGCSKHITGNLKLLRSHGTDLYSITLQETSTPNPICLMAKATSSQAWKAKRKSFHTKTTPSSKRRLQLLHMDLCGPMRVESINGKKYVLVIVDDYSRYTWTHFLRSKDETPDVLIDFLRLVQRGLHAQVRTVRTNKGTEFLSKTLQAYFDQEGIEHQTSTAQKPEQNGIVER
ncbi:retrovirus-related pol polyprotein from transposon TNT 1-94 [Tanacetum coccineum]|uniref:Retrovirus-related pol polyprotein from transposon TNT 1-94 n=1 Tax=Tanacetum coccineum TaxID=301880 RepID=A0ABQ5A2Y5_9ASTR